MGVGVMQKGVYLSYTQALHFLLTKSRLSQGIHVFALSVLTSVVFSNTLDNTYHLDSIQRVAENTEIDRFWPPSRFFTDVRTGSTIPQIAAYRPMMPLSHAINSELAQATGTSRLAAFHVGNIAIHIASTILVYFLFCLLLGYRGAVPGSQVPAVHPSHQAFAAALIFAVHPIAGSAVNYIAARDLLLMVFFFVASMLVYMGMRKTGDTVTGWLWSLLLLCLAILSKPVAIVGFGLVFLFEWILVDTRLKDWRLWARSVLFAIPTAAYFLFRGLWIIEQNTAAPLRVPLDIYYPLTMAKAHVYYYLKNFLWPFEMRALAGFDVVDGIADITVVAGILFIVATLSVAWFFRRRNPVCSFAILAYWLLFALTASIFPFRFVVTDYRQYFPSIFLCLLVTLACFSLKRPIRSISLLAGLTFYFSISSYQINQNWKTDESFWQQSVKYGGVALAHQNYGLAILGKNPQLAEQHFLEAIAQEPLHIYANINLGMLHIRTGKVDEGLARLHRMVALNPDWALARYWLSEGLRVSGETEEALTELESAANLDPKSLKYQFEAARALQEAGEHAAAIPYFERIIDRNPEYRQTRFWLGFAYQQSGQSQNAIDKYGRFLGDTPDHVQGHFNLAYEQMSEDDCDKAIAHFNRVLELRPGYTEAHLHLSRCYQSLGDDVSAQKHEKIYRTTQ